MSPAMLVSPESIYNVHHFDVSPTTTAIFVEEIRVVEFYPDLRNIINFKAGLLKIYVGYHQQYGDHHKVHGKGFILVQVLS